jgi:hypothetical protein
MGGPTQLYISNPNHAGNSCMLIFNCYDSNYTHSEPIKFQSGPRWSLRSQPMSISTALKSCASPHEPSSFAQPGPRMPLSQIAREADLHTLYFTDVISISPEHEYNDVNGQPLHLRLTNQLLNPGHSNARWLNNLPCLPTSSHQESQSMPHGSIVTKIH